jgi:hypothetical protein
VPLSWAAESVGGVEWGGFDYCDEEGKGEEGKGQNV